LKFICQ